MKECIHNFFGDNIYTPIEILSDNNLSEVLRPIFNKLCLELGLKENQALEFTNLVWSQRNISDISNFEDCLHNHINKIITKEKITFSLEKRAQLIVKQIYPYIKGNTITDIGCGDGLVSWFLRKKDRNILLTDVNFYLDKRVNFPFYQYTEGKSLNFIDIADTSLLITVLHHTKNPIYLLQQTRKITKMRLLVIESVIGVEKYNGSPESYLYELDFDQQRKYAIFFDWFYNRVLHKDVSVPYNYLTISNWKKVFEADQWNVSQTIDLGVEQNLVPEHHVLFVLDR